MNANLNVVIVMPVYDDWNAAAHVCRALNAALQSNPRDRFEILLVDDGSNEPPPGELLPALERIARVRILHLQRNVGHQRAIAIAFSHISDAADLQPDLIVVMDADGEDRPADVPVLIDAVRSSGGSRIVFAARRKRLDTAVFQAGYALYRQLHRLLTGFKVRVGNFSAVPFQHVSRLVVSSEMWSHYAAAVIAMRIPVHLVPVDRDRRVSGTSKMNYVSLVAHGLAALLVFRERIAARLLIAAAALLVLLAGAVMITLPLTAGAEPATRTWLAAGFVVALVLICQLGAAALAFAFGVLANRDASGFVPIRDYKFFVRGTSTIHEPDVPVSR